jgi:outer membrane murein-binding lipoprotein Lpp
MNDTEQVLILGRLEGKVDAIASAISSHASRMDGLDRRLGHLEQDVSAIKSSGAASKMLLTFLISGGAFLVSAANLLIGRILH